MELHDAAAGQLQQAAASSGARQGGGDIPAALSLACGCVSGLVTSTVTFPLDVIRRRMQVGEVGGSRACGCVSVPGGRVWEGGVLLEATVPHLVSSMHRVGSSLGVLCCSGVCSGAFSCLHPLLFACFTAVRHHPLLHVLQVTGGHLPGQRAPGYTDIIRGIVRQQGLRGFYVGIIPEYCKVVPGVAVAFCTYEEMKRLLRSPVQA